jgi:hypothetical protein
MDIFEAYPAIDHFHIFGEESRFVPAPDPDLDPEPYFDGMFFDEIVGEMNRMEDEEWNQRMYEEQMRWEWEHDYDNERY